MNTKQILNIYSNKWVVKYTNDDRQNIELNKMYSKKFNTDYMILGRRTRKYKNNTLFRTKKWKRYLKIKK